MKNLDLKDTWEKLSTKSKVVAVVIFVFLAYCVSTVLYVDPCNCAKIASKRSLGVSYDSGDWERCKNRYYGVSTMNIECAKGN